MRRCGVQRTLGIPRHITSFPITICRGGLESIVSSPRPFLGVNLNHSPVIGIWWDLDLGALIWDREREWHLADALSRVVVADPRSCVPRPVEASILVGQRSSEEPARPVLFAAQQPHIASRSSFDTCLVVSAHSMLDRVIRRVSPRSVLSRSGGSGARASRAPRIAQHHEAARSVSPSRDFLQKNGKEVTPRCRTVGAAASPRRQSAEQPARAWRGRRPRQHTDLIEALVLVSCVGVARA